VGGGGHCLQITNIISFLTRPEAIMLVSSKEHKERSNQRNQEGRAIKKKLKPKKKP
jgi:hypothetical protein